MVLNLANNPIERQIEFKKNVKRILPKLMLVNPPDSMKVSCFEKFKELAFLEKAFESVSNLPTPKGTQPAFTLLEGVRVQKEYEEHKQ